MSNLFKVSFIVIGVIIASFGEVEFVLIGFLFQLGGIVFEALRLVMVQKLLSSAEYKMDPLVSLYYFAPICAIMNFCVAAVVEIPGIKLAEIYHVGLLTLLANAVVAFALNVSVVFLVSDLPRWIAIVAELIVLDWAYLFACPYSMRCPQRYSTSLCLDRHLGEASDRASILRLQHCIGWIGLLQAWG